MIKGFEKITHELTEEEKKLIQPFIVGLSKKIGKENAISNKTIRQKFQENRSLKISDVRVRKVINHIRRNDLLPLLCSNSKGYYIAKTRDEVNDYLIGLKQRISEQQTIHDSIKRQFEKKILNS